MKVTVRTLLIFRDILGKREIELDVSDGAIVDDLLQELMTRYGEPLIRALWDARLGLPVRHVRLLVNGQDIHFMDGLATQLYEGDELLIIPQAAG